MISKQSEQINKLEKVIMGLQDQIKKMNGDNVPEDKPETAQSEKESRMHVNKPSSQPTQPAAKPNLNNSLLSALSGGF